MERKAASGIMLALILISVLILAINIQSVDASPDWLSGWNYRKSHLINGATGAGTNYQIRVNVHYGGGTDNGEDVYLNGKCRSDFGDIRFTDDDGSTELDYWMEEKVDSDYAIFWVEVKDDLSSQNQNIYIYYGNLDATTTSNGDNTFIFFDDFLGTSLDTSKWSTTYIGGGRYSVSDSQLHLSYSGSGGNNPVINTVSQYASGNRAFECKFKINSINSQSVGFNLRSALTEGPALQYKCYLLASSVGIHEDNHICNDGDGAYEFYQNFLTWRTGTWYRLAHKLTSGMTRWERDSTSTSWGGSFSQNIYIMLGFYVANYQDTAKTFNVDFDWVFIRKYVSPESGHGGWGREEMQHPEPTPPFWMQWWFWSIITAVAIASAIVVYFSFLMKKKPPTPTVTRIRPEEEK